MPELAVKFLEIRDLSVTYASREGVVRALDGIDLEIGKGEVLGILGESGCGKSTLAKALLSLFPTNAHCAGEISFRGCDLLKLREAELCAVRGREISLISQDPALSLNPVMAVGTQIAEVLRAHLELSGKERRERVEELLQEVGFDRPAEIYRAYPHQLSGGQRQRAVIAQAIACRPALIIADEATSKLDAALRAEIIQLLSRIRLEHGTAIVAITHDPAMLPDFADRIAVMYAGKIVETGNCGEILRRPLHPYTEALVRLANPAASDGAPGGKKRFAVIEGELPDLGVAAAGCRFEPRCADRLQRCAQNIPRQLRPEPARSVSCFKYGE